MRRRERPVGRSEKIIAVGASTGGVEALKLLLMDMPAECPPILITQHMPPRFTAAFAERLNRECPMNGVRGQARRRRRAQPCLHRARLASYGTGPQRAAITQLRLDDGPHGLGPSAIGGIFCSVRWPVSPEKPAIGVIPDRHGQRRVQRSARHAKCGSHYARSGTKLLR